MENFKFQGKEILNPYTDWQFRMGKEGNSNIGELDYIRYVLFNDVTDSQIDKALELSNKYYRQRNDLIADLYIKKGDFDNALRSIIDNEDSTLNESIADSLEELIDQYPDKKEEIIEIVKNSNKKLFEKFLEEVK